VANNILVLGNMHTMVQLHSYCKVYAVNVKYRYRRRIWKHSSFRGSSKEDADQKPCWIGGCHR